MFGIRWSGFQGRIIALSAVALVGMVTLWAVLQTAQNTVKINGELYNSIVLAQDLANDVTPPVLFVGRAYLHSIQMATEPDLDKAKAFVTEFKLVEEAYRKRLEYWERSLPEGPIKSAVRQDLTNISDEYYATANRELLPRILAGQQEAALGVLRTVLSPIYERQRIGSQRVAALAAQSQADAEAKAREAVSFWGTVSVAVFVVVLAAVVIAGWTITRSLVRPANQLLKTMSGMAGGAGDLTTRITSTSQDEVGDLGRAINQVIQKLHDLVVSVRESSLQLYTTSTEIASTAREQEGTMQSLGASTTQIAAAVKEITATSHELSGTMNAVNEGGKATGALARTGRVGLAAMGDTMTRLAESTASIAGKLSAVRERAHDITAVITTITKVADQTNLLSINAAIEAEKAGESGRGFLVVAREIRRLADQTAVATLDIENMVRQMQGAVSAGVMEMDKFTEEVRVGVGKVSEIKSQMGQIIEEVSGLNDRFQSVNEAMGQQSSGAAQIDDAMHTLVSGVQDTSARLREFNAVTVNLREAADALRTQVSKFTVAG